MKYLVALVLFGAGLFSSCCSDDNAVRQDDMPVRIGIAWRGDSTAITFVSTLQSVREAGAVPVVLPLLKSPFMEYDSNQLVAEYTDEHGIVLREYADKVKADPFAGQDIACLLDGLDGLVFTGGSDISPTLYKSPEPWHGIEAEGNCDGRRDVSDYILMRWCLEREPQLPVLCICRGMQMLSVVSGAQMIQDLHTCIMMKKTIDILRLSAIIETERYGLVAMMPIGMSQICSCNWIKSLHVGLRLNRGDEMGYFLFGGSDIVIL